MIHAIGIIDTIMPNRQGNEALFVTARRMLIVEALVASNGNQQEAARLIGSNPRVLCYDMSKFGLVACCRYGVKV
jgi:transcriptional regulator with GAF, ATPase, and Fis domain